MNMMWILLIGLLTMSGNYYSNMEATEQHIPFYVFNRFLGGSWRLYGGGDYIGPDTAKLC